MSEENMPKCPKCGSDDVTDNCASGTLLEYQCNNLRCYCYWTDWQQAEIEQLRTQLKAAQDHIAVLEAALDVLKYGEFKYLQMKAKEANV